MGFWPRIGEITMPNDETIEQPRESCGLMVTYEGGVGVKVNLKATREEVIEKIQNWLSSDVKTLIRFETSNPDEQEDCLISPNKILLILVRKEFIMESGRIVPASMASPGVNPASFKH